MLSRCLNNSRKRAVPSVVCKLDGFTPAPTNHIQHGYFCSWMLRMVGDGTDHGGKCNISCIVWRRGGSAQVMMQICAFNLPTSCRRDSSVGNRR